MKCEGVAPVTRTYNTLMIACNTSNQWQEALRVYDELVTHGHQPNTTTYNALISGGGVRCGVAGCGLPKIGPVRAKGGDWRSTMPAL